ncbi:MAG: hypothetical protein IK092_03770 [Muribaculaceae bacterium]|nr:hypothetical protein [Muribaculaceae bacterium]
MKKILIIALSSTMLILSGCSSSNQFYGAMTGASVGGMFGSAIGGITGGPRGHDVGRLAGMAIGGIVGAKATAPKTSTSSKQTVERVSETVDYQTYDYYSPLDALEIENLRFVDSNNNQSIDAGEHAKLVFEIRNHGNEFVYDIAPVIKVNGTKQIYVSPTAIVSELAPGRAVRYQAEVVATNKLKSGSAEFTISFMDSGDNLYPMRQFELRTRGK